MQGNVNKKWEGSCVYKMGTVRGAGLFVWLYVMVALDGGERSWFVCMVVWYSGFGWRG
jgi:hypothetical protein